MKKSVLILLVFGLIGIAMISCAGGAEPQGDESPTAETGAAVTPQAEQETAEESPMPEIAETPDQAPEETAFNAELAEPEIELAEADSPAQPPEEAPLTAALPEPEAPDLPLLQEPAPVVEAPPPVQPAPPAPPASAPAVPPTPAAPSAPRPPPPAYLGPAEEERPPALVREPVPIPASPALEPPVPITPVPRPQEEEIVFSRIVRATVGQLVEIPFRGSGWVYLGELGSRRGIVYDSRRLDPEGQSFIFRTEAAGTHSLKFYKQDFIRDFILNDHVQVLVGEPPASSGSGWFNPPLDRGRVIAEPRWPSSLEEAERRRNDTRPETPDTSSPNAPPAAASPANDPLPAADTPGAATAGGPAPAAGNAAAGAAPAASAASGQQPPGTSAAVTPPGTATPDAAVPESSPDMLPENYLQKAREEFEAGKVASAIVLLDQFRERYPSGSDEAYWLYGQFYEANSPSRDILTALDYYRRLIREYPQSSRYNDARRRIAYLERYYINIQ
jgi:TolA-binding protein